MTEKNKPTHTHYPKIKNHTQGSQVARARLFAQQNPGVQWIGTEKIHGCNLSISAARGGDPWVASRRRILRPGDELYGYQDALAHDDTMARILGLIGAIMRNPDIERVTVYGELCGGAYPGTESTRRPVQTEVLYCRDVRFVAFDVLVATADGSRFLARDNAKILLEGAGVPVAPEVYRGPIPERFDDFTTRVPELLGEDPAHATVAEGMVLVPNIAHSYDQRQSIGLKYKSAKFCEKRGRTAPPDLEPLSDENKALLATLAPLICPARVVAVASKETEGIHPGKLAALVALDALEEMDARRCDKRVRQSLAAMARPLADDFVEGRR